MRWSLSTVLLLSAACTGANSDPTTSEVHGNNAELSLPSGLDVLASSWDMAGHDSFASHNNSVEFSLHSRNVDSLDVAWIFDEEDFGKQLGAIHGTPVVTD